MATAEGRHRSCLCGERISDLRIVLSPKATFSVLWFHAAWIVVLTLAVAVGVERFGFNPTDQGFVIAQSWRLLHGELPHLDIVSARPLGSAYLHIVDIVLPGPMFITSIFIASFQVVVFTVLLASWITGTRVRDWSILRSACVSGAALVNVHQFPMNAWHTIDGIFLTACGLWALDRGLETNRVCLYRAGLFLLGFAAITKQSFVPAVAVGIVVLFMHPVVRGQGVRIGRRSVDLGVLVGAPLIYLSVVSAAGGFGDMFAQLTGGAGVVGRRLIYADASVGQLACLVIFGVAALLVVLRTRVRLSSAGVVVACASILLVIVEGGLERAGTWGIVLLWMLALSILMTASVGRVIPWRSIVMVLLAWMVSLSWGYDSPTLIGGSIALAAIDLLVSLGPARQKRSQRGALQAAAAVLIVGLAASFLVVEQAQSPYRDLPRAELTASLGAVAPELRGIRSNSSMLVDLEQIRDCVRSHPAEKTAVLPDNPYVYPALGLRNPFPLDWMLPMELIADTRQRIIAVADELKNQGSFLILFSTVTPEDLAIGAPVPNGVGQEAPIVDPTGTLTEIRGRAGGQSIVCGSFVGVWSQ
ncbi:MULTISPECIES: hypothetical protein [Nocardiaceae]|uniref:hypothetical protein n=1 Tax=Nocardiaceae TaxID=85025 RepID=UPI0011402394|nr:MULTISPECIES: hypothetical protein [Rhodococcus]MDI9933062.1 hypothetical protein [Rhodococcus sp. IEGM 1354]MDJ0409175.1 hypothetical protein [Rhodococcus fascians]